MHTIGQELVYISGQLIFLMNFFFTSNLYITQNSQEILLIHFCFCFVYFRDKSWNEYMYVAADCFYIALFSALEQTHCTLVACDSR